MTTTSSSQLIHRLRQSGGLTLQTGRRPLPSPPPKVPRDIVGLLARRPELRELDLADVLEQSLRWGV